MEVSSEVNMLSVTINTGLACDIIETVLTS